MYQQQNKQEIKLWKSAPKNKNKGKTEIMMADKNQLHNYRWEDTLPFYFLAPQIISVKIPIKTTLVKRWNQARNICICGAAGYMVIEYTKKCRIGISDNRNIRWIIRLKIDIRHTQHQGIKSIHIRIPKHTHQMAIILKVEIIKKKGRYSTFHKISIK